MIEIQGLNKNFGELAALREVSLTFESGQVTIIGGPNASGKSTLIKCILGLNRPDTGVIRVFGTAVGRSSAYRADIGYMPQDPRFPDNLTGREILTMLKDIRGYQEEPEAELITFFELGSFLHKPVRTLSGGIRQRLSALVALLFQPRILILDEPTAGLDPLTSERMKDRIRLERDRGRLVLLTTHQYRDMEDLADRLVFLLEGRVCFDGSLLDLRYEADELRLDRAVARLMEGSPA